MLLVEVEVVVVVAAWDRETEEQCMHGTGVGGPTEIAADRGWIVVSLVTETGCGGSLVSLWPL